MEESKSAEENNKSGCESLFMDPTNVIKTNAINVILITR
jgi:hypothetical protein